MDRPDEDELTRAVMELARQYGRYGYRRITALLRNGGWQVGQDRVQQVWRREGRIFVLRTEEGLVVKRAGKGTDGGWQLVSDHPRWPDAPWPDDLAIVGEVRWMAREL